MSAFPACQVPDFKTAAPADEGDLAFQVKLLAKFIRKEKPALFIGRTMLGLGMKLPQVDAQIARRNAGNIFRRGTDPLKFVRGHHEQKLTVRLGNHEELIDRTVAPPARRNRDAIFVVDLMTEFSRVKNGVG